MIRIEGKCDGKTQMHAPY